MKDQTPPEAVAVVLVLCLLLCSVFAPAAAVPVTGAPKFPAIYVFGDSTVDVGNNDYLPGGEVPRANFPHYGVDFPGSTPTGRFGNGFILSDFIAKLMGFDSSPPPYLALARVPRRDSMTRGLAGVNYASAGSGILNATGAAEGLLSMWKQIEFFAETKSMMKQMLHPAMLEGRLARSLFVISTGGNDLGMFAKRNASVSPEQNTAFISDLILIYQNQIESLFKLGARKFAMVDAMAIGCVPGARILDPAGGCIVAANSLAEAFNSVLTTMMATVSSKLEGMEYSIGRYYTALTSILMNPSAAGFTEVAGACCGEGWLNAQVVCGPDTPYCADRRLYVFWDNVHHTEAAVRVMAVMYYNGSSKFSTPISFSKLVGDAAGAASMRR